MSSRNVLLAGVVVVAVAVLTSGGNAAPVSYNLALSGANEPDASGNLGVGDPDGFANGVLTLDPDNDTVSWNFTYGNISGANISGFHIHGPGATRTTNVGIIVHLEPLTMNAVPNGTLTGTRTVASTPSTDLTRERLSAQIDQILANPEQFYVNLHSANPGGYPGGAVRQQLPEPSSWGLVGLGALALAARRRRRTA